MEATDADRLDEDAQKCRDWQLARCAAREVNDTFCAEDDIFGTTTSSWHSDYPHPRTNRFEYRHRMQSWQVN